MNLTLLKSYAPAARKAFIEAVTRRAELTTALARGERIQLK